MDTELLPCPFCGYEAESYGYDTAIDKAFVKCTYIHCGAEVYGDTEVEAVAAWNRRAEQLAPAVPVPDTLEAVLREVTNWQHAQFPRRTAHSIATHLLEEATELQREPTDSEEMADVMMLLAGLAHFNQVNLADAVRAKLVKNKARIWGKPDEHGVVKHVDNQARPQPPQERA